MPSHEQPPSADLRILFVCLGNICRSPVAEAVLRHLVEADGLGESVVVESAGTGGWHVGQSPDTRSVRTARRHGIDVHGAARRVSDADFSSFDLIVAMDRSNLGDLQEIASRVDGSATLHLLREFDDRRDTSNAADLDVPDPYYGGPEGFEIVFDIVLRSCANLLDRLRERIRA